MSVLHLQTVMQSDVGSLKTVTVYLPKICEKYYLPQFLKLKID